MDNWEEAAIAALKAYWHPDDPAYTNWQMDIFLAGYRAALAAREAEVERLGKALQEIEAIAYRSTGEGPQIRQICLKALADHAA